MLYVLSLNFYSQFNFRRMTEQEWKNVLDQIKTNKGEWVETTEYMYDHFLGSVPPLRMGSECFINSEPYDHDIDGVWYHEFAKREDKHYGRLILIKYKKPQIA